MRFPRILDFEDFFFKVATDIEVKSDGIRWNNSAGDLLLTPSRPTSLTQFYSTPVQTFTDNKSLITTVSNKSSHKIKNNKSKNFSRKNCSFSIFDWKVFDELRLKGATKEYSSGEVTHFFRKFSIFKNFGLNWFTGSEIRANGLLKAK